MIPFIPNPWVIVGALVGAMILFSTGVYSGHHYGWLQQQAQLLDDALETIGFIKKQEVITAAVSHRAAEDMAQIVTVFRTITKLEKEYVTDKAVAACVIPDGFVRVLDAASRAEVPVPYAAGRPDDRPAATGPDARPSVSSEDPGRPLRLVPAGR